MGFFTQTMSKMVRKRYGSNFLSPQMSEVEALVGKVELVSADQIGRLPKTAESVNLVFPATDASFTAIFSVANGSGRLDAVIDCQDYISDLAMTKISRQLSDLGYDNGFAIVANMALVALYMRDWIDRRVTDEQFAKFNQPPFFEIQSRSFSQSDYQNAITPWVSVFGPVHPLD